MFVLDTTREKKTVKKLQSKQVAEVVDSNGTHNIVRDHQNRYWMTVPESKGVSLYPMKSNAGE